MSQSNIKKVIVIGYGVVAGDVLQYTFDNAINYGYSVEYIEHEVYPFNCAIKFASYNSIKYQVIENKQKLISYFMNLSNDNILIISASSNFIFPKELIKRNNITIINFHNALLPELPGRNAPSWAIYQDRLETGITWHYVTDGIDEGDIIIQKVCTITKDMKAYELVAKLMQLATNSFIECFEDVLLNNVTTRSQTIKYGRKIYKSTEIPGNGKFDLTDSPIYIYRLLRSMDYGKNQIFPAPVTKCCGKEIRVKRYKVISRKIEEKGENTIKLYIDNNRWLQIKYEHV